MCRALSTSADVKAAIRLLPVIALDTAITKRRAPTWRAGVRGGGWRVGPPPDDPDSLSHENRRGSNPALFVSDEDSPKRLAAQEQGVVAFRGRGDRTSIDLHRRVRCAAHPRHAVRWPRQAARDANREAGPWKQRPKASALQSVSPRARSFMPRRPQRKMAQRYSPPLAGAATVTYIIREGSSTTQPATRRSSKR